MPIKDQIDKLRRRWAAWRHSKRTNSLLLYLTCLVISFLFWLFLTLNNETQKDLSLPLQLTSIPDSTTIISGLPQQVKVSVRDKGSSLLRYDFGNQPTMSINFMDFFDGSGNFKISSIEMLARVRRLFSNTTTVVAIAPDSLSVKYTSQPGRRVPVRLNMDVTADFRYVINGPTVLSHDSVTVYSDLNTLGGITAVSTQRVSATGQTDTVTRTIDIAPIAGAKIVPSSITVTVPIEPLISKKIMASIEVINAPQGVNLVTFPSTIEASFLVPQSDYHNQQQVNAVVNYNDIIRSAGGNKTAVTIVATSPECRDISLATDSVEYIVEKIL